MKDVEENEELHEKPECLSNKGREDVNRWMKRKLTRWAMESVGKKITLRTDETEKQRRRVRSWQYEMYLDYWNTEKMNYLYYVYKFKQVFSHEQQMEIERYNITF